MSLENAKQWIEKAQRVVGFSGAGISTESGIPDFRSPGGVWSQNRTVMFDEFQSSRAGREEYWRQKVAIWPEMRKADPNPGHMAFVHVHETGCLAGMITQNIEGLHQRSGLPDERVIELHGTMQRVTCLDCEGELSMDEACARVAAGDFAPECSCGGYYKPATVSFGQSLVADDLYRASALCRECDVFISVGSSLAVQPAAGFPVMAKKHGARLIIVNRTETPLDGIADLVVRAEIGAVLPEMVGMN